MQLIFLHYFGGGPRSWNGVVSQLDEHAAQTPDLREVGRLPTGYSVQQAATDVLQIVDGLGKPFVLVGHSMGGKIALAIAARQPRNLRGCVLIAPSPPTPEPMNDEDRVFMLDGHGTRAGAEKIVDSAAGSALEPDVWETAIEANLAYSDRDWGNWIEIGTREDISGAMPDIKVPLLVVAGALDEGMTPDLLRETIVSQTPDSRLEEIVGAGHLMPQEKPEIIAGLIRDFVASLD